MSASQWDATMLAIAVAAACAVPGVWLVLRRLALISDAISHVLLFGIVLAYFVVKDLYSPWLMVGAAISGVLTVSLVELLRRSKRVQQDAAIGLVFPTLFAIGTILASMYCRGTHLDVDNVLLGHIEYITRREQVWLGSIYLGRSPTVIMFALFAVNVALSVFFYKELKLTTFDPTLAATLGFMPVLVHYSLMTNVSLTTVAAFDSVGPALVVAFLVVPAITARLLTDQLLWLFVLSVAIAVSSAFIGVWLAFRWQTNTAGTITVTLGIAFGAVQTLSLKSGWVMGIVRRYHQRLEFYETMLTIHLFQHEDTPHEFEESRIDGLHRHLHWERERVQRIIERARWHGLVIAQGESLRLTERGRERARSILGEAPAV